MSIAAEVRSVSALAINVIVRAAIIIFISKIFFTTDKSRNFTFCQKSFPTCMYSILKLSRFATSDATITAIRAAGIALSLFKGRASHITMMEIVIIPIKQAR